MSRPAAPQHVRPRPGPTARRRKRRQSRARRRQLLILLIGVVMFTLVFLLLRQPSSPDAAGGTGTGAGADDRPLESNITHGLISDSVIAYRDTVADYAAQNDISDITDAQTIDQDAARLYMVGNTVAFVPDLDHIT